MKSIPRSLQAEIASACSDALQVLSIDKQLLNSMLAGGPIGCKYVEVQLELIQQYIAERAYSTVSRLQSSCLPHLQGLWNRVANLYLLTW